MTSEAPKDLISKLLVVDPKRRYTVDEALKHEFFQVLVREFFFYSCYMHVITLIPAPSNYFVDVSSVNNSIL